MSFFDQPEFDREGKHEKEQKQLPADPHHPDRFSSQPPPAPSGPPPSPEPQREKPKWLIPIISALIGGLIVLLFVPLLIRTGLLPITGTQGKNAEGETDLQTTSVQVNSQITEAVNKVRPAVVGIENIGQSGGMMDNQEGISQGTGSGIIFKKEGEKAYVVTNYHVIQGANQVKVTIPLDNNKSRSVDAKVLGSDPTTDLAVLEMSSEGVNAVAQFGNSDTLKVGEPAIAIGNPLGPQFSQTVTVGVISSTHRTIQVNEHLETDVVQTDAAINPGNSGGALVNVAGQVIGINSLKIAQSGVEGLGFAIPANDAIPIIQSLIKYGRVPRPYLGVTLIDLHKLPISTWQQLKLPNNLSGGVLIHSVDLNTPAQSAGIKENDVIVALDGQPVNTGAELRRYLYKNKSVGSTVKVTFYRDGAKQTVDVKLSDTPS